MTVGDLIMLLAELPWEATVLVDDDGSQREAMFVEPLERPTGSSVLIA